MDDPHLCDQNNTTKIETENTNKIKIKKCYTERKIYN